MYMNPQGAPRELDRQPKGRLVIQAGARVVEVVLFERSAVLREQGGGRARQVPVALTFAAVLLEETHATALSLPHVQPKGE